MSKKRYFAVSYGNWIEIREAVNPPKEVVSEGVVKTRLVGYHDYWNNRYHPGRLVSTKIKQTVFKGGKVLKTVKKSLFLKKTGLSVGKNRMAELVPSVVNLVLNQE